MSKWEVSSQDSGIKLQAFLKKRLEDQLSGKQIKDALERGCCLVNDRGERFANRILGDGDRVEFQYESRVIPQAVNILYDDGDLIICYKPAGITSEDTLPSQKLVHRLDKETSGVLIHAKNSKALEAMKSLFKERQVAKSYLAIVDGIPSTNSGKIENYLGKLKEYHGQTIWGAVSEKGLYAKTEWTLQKKGKDAALLLCHPETGRTHQIRVHLSELGHPILGDNQYGRKFKCAFRPKRCLLHASEIAFKHPITNKQIQITAPLPDDFQEVLCKIF